MARVRSRTWLWVIVALASIFLLVVVVPLMVLGPVVADRELGGADDWGLIAAAMGIGVIVGSTAVGRLRPKRPMFVAVVLCVGPGFFAIALGLTLPVVAIAAVGFVAGATEGVFEVIWITALQQRVTPAALARVSAYDALGSFVFMPLGFAIAGPAAEAFGTRGAVRRSGIRIRLERARRPAPVSPRIPASGAPRLQCGLTYGGDLVSTWSVLRQSCKPRSPVGLVKQPGATASADNNRALALAA